MSDVLGYNVSVTDETYSANAYDAIWTLALALQEAEGVLGRRLDSYRYGDEEYARVVGKIILNQTFVGMSVRIFKTQCIYMGSMECDEVKSTEIRQMV